MTFEQATTTAEYIFRRTQYDASTRESYIGRNCSKGVPAIVTNAPACVVGACFMLAHQDNEEDETDIIDLPKRQDQLGEDSVYY